MISSRNICDPNFQIDANLGLSDDEVQLWRVDLAAVRKNEARWQEVLSSNEKARASRFHFSSDRQNFAAARALLRTILGGILTSDPASLGFVYSKKEKPSLARPWCDSEIQFNVSHSGGIALYAFSRGRYVGIDIEDMRREVEIEAIARRFFSAHEQEQLTTVSGNEKVGAFFRCWTRKEAYIKATGDGLSLPLSQFDVSIDPGHTNALLATRPDGLEAKRWRLSDVAAGEGYMAAVCVRGDDWRLNPWG